MSAVTFVLRFDSTLQLNVHFHVLVPDGAFDHDGVFVAEEAPDDHDVRGILVRAGCKVIALLHRFLSRPPGHQGALRYPADARTLGQNEEILGRAKHPLRWWRPQMFRWVYMGNSLHSSHPQMALFVCAPIFVGYGARVQMDHPMELTCSGNFGPPITLAAEAASRRSDEKEQVH